MQGCDYSRVERFLAVEKPSCSRCRRALQMKRHALLTVAPNCFVSLEGNSTTTSTQPFYRQQGGSHLYGHTGRIYHDGSCIATHMRSFKQGGYTWVKEHLPSQTQAYYEYSPQYFIDKGSKYGPMAEHVLRELFSATEDLRSVLPLARASWLSPVRRT